MQGRRGIFLGAGEWLGRGNAIRSVAAPEIGARRVTVARALSKVNKRKRPAGRMAGRFLLQPLKLKPDLRQSLVHEAAAKDRADQRT